MASTKEGGRVRRRRVALLVGIVDYKDETLESLESVAMDVALMKDALSSHWNADDNFEVIERVMRLADEYTAPDLLNDIESALEGASHFLFFFAGHGIPGSFGLQLATPEKESSLDSGVFFDSILHRINGCDVDEVTIILDCCNSGQGGDPGIAGAFRWTQLREGVTVLASCEANEMSWADQGDAGRFTKKLVERLNDRDSSPVTVLDLFTHAAAAQLWGQTPVLRTFGSMFSPLRAETQMAAFVHDDKRAESRHSRATPSS
ncbi:caspase family protein [Microbacterium sp.]|uniref:caspase family protein n=1 Tax=Microbacterium sp. TaxID=51671 RepID=UPI002614CFBB|nr:caspase family protein [Microbacterium sp.]